MTHLRRSSVNIDTKFENGDVLRSLVCNVLLFRQSTMRQILPDVFRSQIRYFNLLFHDEKRTARLKCCLPISMTSLEKAITRHVKSKRSIQMNVEQITIRMKTPTRIDRL